MRKILISLGIITFVGALVVGATGAFFSDSETSTGNTFAAGDIDLQIDNESYAIDFNVPDFQGVPTGVLVFNPNTSWELADLEAGFQKFFNFEDLKPGDYGEDTISIHVGSNDAWLCAAAQITADDDVTCTEPEGDDDLLCAEPGLDLGELDDQVNFAFWHDDGDNVLETDEIASIFLAGPIGGIDDEGQIALADSQGGIMGANEPIPGDSTFYIGKAWCFGALSQDAETQDGQGKFNPQLPEETGNIPNGPTVRGTGVACDGSQVDNSAQTDLVQGDMQFYAVQSRNNSDFICSRDYTPQWPQVI